MEKLKNKNYKFQVRVVHIITKENYIVDCVINKLIEINISLKFSENKNLENPKSTYFYFKLLNKIKKINSLLYYKEI